MFAFVTWLQKPYPMVRAYQQKIFLSIVFGLFIYLFLSLFKPFNIHQVANENSWYIFGFGLITTIVMLLNYMLSPLLFPSFFEEDQWIAGKELLLILSHIFLITLFNYYYNTQVDNVHSTVYDLPYFLFMTVTIGIFPVSFYVFTTELLLSKQQRQHTQQINHQRKEKVVLRPKNSPITIRSESIHDSLTINLDQLVFIKSEGNYCKVHFLVDQKLTTKLLRISLKNIEQQLAPTRSIVRCHRSYIINKKHLIAISGNARSYTLQIGHFPDLLPVSRSFSKELLL